MSASSSPGTASFRADVTRDDALAFAKLSGDWNPLHTDETHAAKTAYRYPVLHGAFSAGLLSRMAGMHLPGADCLLHGMRLRFVRPIIPPVALHVEGRVVADNGQLGHVEVVVSDVDTGARYVEGGYDFSRHEHDVADRSVSRALGDSADAVTVVTGATGGLGRAVLSRVGANAVGISRSPTEGLLHVTDVDQLGDALGTRAINAIVHCAWPAPDNQGLTTLANVEGAVEHNLADPVRQIISLGRLLRERGTPNALLVLIGSTASLPGRHLYRSPLYSISKSLVPAMARVLAVELAGSDRRVVALTFDVIEAGMNKRLTPAIRAMHADRAPTGKLPSADDAAEQIAWVLGNRSFLASGATIDLSGSAIP